MTALQSAAACRSALAAPESRAAILQILQGRQFTLHPALARALADDPPIVIKEGGLIRTGRTLHESWLLWEATSPRCQ